LLRPVRRVIGLLLIAGLLAGFGDKALGGTLKQGDILVADFGQRAILRVDPLTGSRSTLSGAGVSSGPLLVQPRGITIDRFGQIFVSDAGEIRKSIFRIDAVTGGRTIVSGPSVGSGDNFEFPLSLEIDSSGNLFVVDLLLKAVFQVNTANGQRTIISSPAIGSGPPLQNPASLTIDESGFLLVGDQSLDAIVRIDPNSGNRTVISGAGVGTGPAFLSPVGSTVGPSGTLYVSDASLVILAVNQSNGNRQLVSGAARGSGPAFESIRGIAREASGSLLAVDATLDQLIRVNVGTGDRLILSSPNPTSEPVFLAPDGIATVGLLEIVGDYNGNGRVDTADYTVWRDMLGSVVIRGTGADGNYDSNVDMADYSLWRMNFGAVIPASAVTSTVIPEPATPAFLGQIVFGVLILRVRRPQRRFAPIARSIFKGFMLGLELVPPCSESSTVPVIRLLFVPVRYR
jgi:sugar lactone lactonase YvrE